MFSIHETSPLKRPLPEDVEHETTAPPPTRSLSSTSSIFARFSSSMRRSRSSPISPVLSQGAFERPPSSLSANQRSNSSLSWFSDDESDEEEGSKARWGLSTLRKKRCTRPALPNLASLTRTTPLPPNLSPSPPPSPKLEPTFILPAPKPLDLDLQLDFEHGLPSSSSSRPSSSQIFPSSRHSFDTSSTLFARNGRQISWAPSTAVSSFYSRAPSSRRSSESPSDGWAETFSLSSPRLPYSPDMMEVEDEEGEPTTQATPKAARVDHREDHDLHAFFAGTLSSTPTPPGSPTLPTPPTMPLPPLPLLHPQPSIESLMDPAMPPSPPSSLPNSPSINSFGLDFPLPPPSRPSTPSPTSALSFMRRDSVGLVR
ncbi:hypothetical protein JCM6882_006373 [Rhodosporidiobolus microsporus]